MYNIYLLTGVLTDFQIKFLELIQYLHHELRNSDTRRSKPIIVLPYSYIAALLNCSHSSVKLALDRLAELNLITQVSNNFGECATYHYNPSAYHSLIRQAKQSERTLITGRKKQSQKIESELILKYVIGKSKKKAAKLK